MNWIRTHGIASAVIALLIGIGIGASGSESTDNSEEVADLRARLADAEEAAEEAEAAAEARADETIRDMEQELRDEAAELDKVAKALDRREREIRGAEKVAEKSRIDDGVWEVGTEISPGTYRAPGGSGCYWALLNSADTSDISNNGGFGPNQTVTLSGGWFESRDCGTWEKIG